MELAVIIPCKNEATTLPQQLDALAAQTWDGDWEVIVVDNNSDDGTPDVALAHEGLRGRLRVVRAMDAAGVAYARRCGVNATDARAVVFCDGDDVVAPGWVAGMGDALRRHDFVTGNIDIDLLNGPTLAATRGRRRIGLEPKFGPHTFLRGNNSGMTRERWDAYDGFDETFVGLEDIELSLRVAAAGDVIHFAENALVHYRYRDSPRVLWRQGMFYGSGRVRLARRCLDLGLEPPPRTGALKSWVWLLLFTPLAPLARYRKRWIWTAANRMGALRVAIDRDRPRKRTN